MLQDVDVVVALDVVVVDMDVALVREPDASEEATQAVVPCLMAIKVEDILGTPDILLASLKVKVKVVVRFVPTMGTTMVHLLNVSKPMMVATSMEEDIGLHSILPVDAVVTLSVIGILDARESEAVLITPIIIMFRKEMATLPIRPVVIVVMISRNLLLKDTVMMIILTNLMFNQMIIIISMTKEWISRRSIMVITDC